MKTATIERVLALVGIIGISLVLTGQVTTKTDYPNFVQSGKTYITSTGAQLTVKEAGGGNWFKCDTVIGGNSSSGSQWVNISRYEWIQEQQ
jgi:hypothetical protein